MNGNAEPVQAPAAFATNEAEGGATGRRPQRSRGFSILNEELLLELHAEMMGMEPPKARAPAKKPPLPPAKLPQNGPANGHAQLDKASEPSRDGSPPEQRPLKRQKSEDQKSERSKPSKGAAVSSGSDDDPFGPEEFTAWACGLNHLGLSEDEAGLLPEGADEEVYARVRNEVLVKWRADCSRRLTLEAALADYPDDEKPYALAAWKFLEGELNAQYRG